MAKNALFRRLSLSLFVQKDQLNAWTIEHSSRTADAFYDHGNRKLKLKTASETTSIHQKIDNVNRVLEAVKGIGVNLTNVNAMVNMLIFDYSRTCVGVRACVPARL